ncbi:MAG: 4-alpha-glucanotransferase [Ruminococcaceae bacterium]|nr:4-alpha-glucanotransferase [Oscillospiraceae bacterium]
MKRAAGVLLPVFSLPSPYGIGCLDSEAYRFLDFLSAAGQSYWQILPLHPTSYGDSPYQSYSTFAGNPLLISLDDFIANGWLTRGECNEAHLQTSPDTVDYGHQYQHRYPLLRRAFENAKAHPDPDLSSFLDITPWLSDYALFMALKNAHGGASWQNWSPELRHRQPAAIQKAREDLREEIDFQIFLQYHFHRQWLALKAYANENHIKIIGDIPIYVAYDSADVWVHPELFCLDENKQPHAVAGCPPDGFSPDGQVWGNPLYDWPTHAATGYSWWLRRLDHACTLYDVVRIDHFRGFDAYFSIPYGHTSAKSGHWEAGPGMDFFDTVTRTLGQREIIAEDLGFMTSSVRRLVKDSGFPGMRVLQFGFDARDTGGTGEHLPHNYPNHCVAYTGTHDNQTLASWLQTITDEERDWVRGYLKDNFTPSHLLPRCLISLLFQSPANLCIVPMQDWLGLDDRARINTPSTQAGNWRWRMSAGSASPALAQEMNLVTRMYGRAPQPEGE